MQILIEQGPVAGIPTLVMAHALAQRSPQVAAAGRWIEGFDSSPHLAAKAPLPLFFMNCNFDPDQPKHYAIETVRTLRPAWAAHPDRLRLGLYPAGHTVTPLMEDDAVAWFPLHLQTKHI